MNTIEIVCNWSDELIKKIEIELKENNFSNFIKNNATKQQFWYAYTWYFLFFQHFFDNFPKKDLKDFFREGNQIISSMPDLFNDKLFMQAHGLLWFYKFETFYECSIEMMRLSSLLFL